MNSKPNTTVIQLTIQGFVDSREVVNKLNEFYVATGVVTSQKAKYEKPTWFYILAVLGTVKRRMTILDIQAKLAEHGLNITYQSIRRFLIVMMNTGAAIHSHRRNCGVSCHELVQRFGGVHQCYMDVQGPLGTPADSFYIGETSVKANYWRRVHNVYVNP